MSQKPADFVVDKNGIAQDNVSLPMPQTNVRLRTHPQYSRSILKVPGGPSSSCYFSLVSVRQLSSQIRDFPSLTIVQALIV
jgi:hypothetical protein